MLSANRQTDTNNRAALQHRLRLHTAREASVFDIIACDYGDKAFKIESIEGKDRPDTSFPH